VPLARREKHRRRHHPCLTQPRKPSRTPSRTASDRLSASQHSTPSRTGKARHPLRPVPGTLWDPSEVPWIPELFSAPALERVLNEKRRERLAAVPYFAGLMAGEIDALIESFAGEPELHHPQRGRVKGADAFRRFVTETNGWLGERNVAVDDVDLVITPRRTVEEVVVHLDGDNGRVGLPVAIAADRTHDGHLIELRIYFSTWPLTGGHAIRPPLLQPDPAAHERDVVGEYQRALAAGDVEATVATFEPDGYMREPAGDAYVHRGPDELRALYTLFFSNGGGIPLEHCTATDDGRACALEYNVVAWGRTPMPPEAGIAVYVRGARGKLAVARVYDDSDPPLADHS
jgi:SnoaL-like domain